MSGNPVAGAPGAPEPYAPQATYNFSARLALTVSLVLLMITVVVVVIPLMVYLMITRSRRGGGHGLAGGVLRSVGVIRSRRHGLDASALSALPVTAYRKESGAAARAECAVCLAELADGDEARELPNCGHLFHLECVDAWLRTRTTCPLCRAQAAGLPGEHGKAQSSSSSVAAAEPALNGAAGGSLTVTVHGGSPCTGRDALGSTSGSPC
ncbi:hypothetical protein CFC21_068495 [Triticum aestivum]|uniref:RING-type E3 ubiquitin transferase n=3 Tax=Triticum TaxID=4564 RepID=A0A9R0WU88_TRITD|nr:E3 ubiquitin-protein ligase EL5-like [Triticum aestivum]KAF7061831.1 hypothetical protein CFC21_068495 [Triticum aestivum]VAI24037.1 unnamed protein product [Triticum turgidum subsp. durum]